MLIYIEGHCFFLFFLFPWAIFWAKIFKPLDIFGEVSSILLQREAANRYFLCLNQAGLLACSRVLASINSISLDVTFSPCVYLNFRSSFRSTMYWESLSLVSLNENKGYCTYIWLHFLDLADCSKYWSQVVSTHTDYLALSQLALSQNWC